MEAALLERVRSSRRVLLTGPEGPDGDSIGACLALQLAFRTLAPDVLVEVAGRERGVHSRVRDGEPEAVMIVSPFCTFCPRSRTPG